MCLESHKDETDERMRALTGLVYEVSWSYLELFWLFLTIGFQLQATRHLQGDGSVDRPYELLEDAVRLPTGPSANDREGVQRTRTRTRERPGTFFRRQ